MSNADVFRTYLERFTSGDIEGAASLLDDAFSFAGPMLTASSKAEFLASDGGLGPDSFRGCTIHHQWEDGEQVCSFYDFRFETPVGSASIPMAEWTVVRDGKVASSRLVFDTAPMVALMASS
jgi:hypothetical protein